MRFTDEFGVTPTDQDDWFDLECTEDTPLYVDPFLVFDDKDPFWVDAHDHVSEFFGLALDYVSQSQGVQTSPHWGKAERMLTFPEPKEFALGLAMGSPDGAGTGADFATRMADALDLIRRTGTPTVKYVEAFVLFCDGMGVDRISDCFCNIMKSKFIDYTMEVVKRHGIKTAPVKVKHASWMRGNGRWNDPTINLPRSPVTKGGVLLVPERFLKDIPRVTADGFWNWAETHEAQTLRDDLNYDLGQALSVAAKKAEARKVARAYPDLALRYVDEQAATQILLPYDVEQDPKLLVGWAEAGRAAAAASPTEVGQPESEEQFLEWVKGLAFEFKAQVEQTDLWKVLWDEKLTKPRKELVIQAVAGSMWVQQCKAANVDISKEPNMGRGPVDFKFSKGWERRALLEVKLMNSSKFTHGAETQLPQYMKTEKIDCGIYLAVGFTDQDFSKERQVKVRHACEAMTKEKGVTMEAVFVDARHDNKTSASKMKKST